DSNQRICRRRTHHRAVRFSADGSRAQVRCNGSARSGARAARIALEDVWILRLSTTTAPATRRLRRSEIGPLAQVRFAENQCARFAESLSDERVALRLCADERE